MKISLFAWPHHEEHSKGTSTVIYSGFMYVDETCVGVINNIRDAKMTAKDGTAVRQLFDSEGRAVLTWVGDYEVRIRESAEEARMLRP